MIRMATRALAGACLLALAAACAERRAAPAAGGESARQARLVRALDGFYGPEGAKYDAEQDVWFISNMLGYGSAKDGAGYIIRIPAGPLGPPAMFVEGGKNGAVLDAPKGMAIHGDTLWVADIEVLRGFDRRTGAPLATVDFQPQGAVLLNDVTVGHDGRLYVTDSGIRMTEAGVLHPGGDRVFAVGARHAVSVVAAGSALGRPNGIIPEPGGRGLVVVSFDPFHSLAYRLTPGDPRGTLTPIAQGRGKFDGVEPLADGRLLVAAWNDSSIHVMGRGRDQRIIRGLWQPADIGVDTRRNRIAIPQPVRDRVEFWELPG
jgi:hypothetical protein